MTPQSRVLLLARSLDVGGTERQLVELGKGLSKRGHKVRVALFYGGGVLARELEDSGVEIVDLGKSGRWDVLGFLTRTVHELRRARADVVYSFLGGANLAGAIARTFVRRPALIWSIRNSSRDFSVNNAAAHIGFMLESALARVPDAIIANSSAGRDFSIGRGFPAAKIVVVPNGIDVARFRPDPVSRRELRRKFHLTDEDVVIGVLGRLNSIKDHPTFLRAAAIVARRHGSARFLCVGSGPELPRLERIADDLGIADRVIFAGELEPAAALNAFDIACSSSITEGFSNSVAEAMACGLPCVVSDAGDSALIVGDLGTVVPVGSPAALAEALDAQIRALPSHDAQAARARIVEQFSIDVMLDRTLEVFGAACAGRPQSG